MSQGLTRTQISPHADALSCRVDGHAWSVHGVAIERSPDGQQLKVSCPWSVLGSIVGRYYIVGPDRLVRANVDLTELAQELGRLASYEVLADDRTFDSDSEWEQQVEAAVAAAPFVHPRLAPVTVELTSAELRALRDQ